MLALPLCIEGTASCEPLPSRVSRRACGIVEGFENPNEWAAMSGVSRGKGKVVSVSPSRRPCQEHPSLSASHLCGDHSYCGGTAGVTCRVRLHLLQRFPIRHLPFEMQRHSRPVAAPRRHRPWSLCCRCHVSQVLQAGASQYQERNHQQAAVNVAVAVAAEPGLGAGVGAGVVCLACWPSPRLPSRLGGPPRRCRSCPADRPSPRLALCLTS